MSRFRLSVSIGLGLALLGVLVTSQASAERTENYDLKLIMVVLGEADESLSVSTGPNLDIVFSPGLMQAPVDKYRKRLAQVAGVEPTPVFMGAPELFAKWSQQLDLRHQAILFDRAGYGAWEGRLNLSGDKNNRLYTSRGMDYRLKDRTLGDVLEPYCVDGKMIKAGARLRSYQRGNVLALGRIMPDVEVTIAAGELVQLADLAAAGSPILVVFFERPQKQQMTNLMEVLSDLN
ncbi:hypothetical protein ACFL6E_04315 [Candidatus Neomarinimicrobiota bacterium]